MTRLLPLLRHHQATLPGTDRALVEQYAVRSDQAAFAEIVRRHGPMVLGVCRRAARDTHLADDAFQATFLLLARKAASLRDPDALAGWLFGVARRVGEAARRSQRRRVKRESLASPACEPEGCHQPDWDDLLRVLDEELARLPEKYRVPLLACYFEGLTQDEAAGRLGWSLSTVRRRLDAGRELLRERMTARGATLGAGLFVGLLTPTAMASVSDGLARRVADLAAGGPVPAAVRGLVAAGPPAVAWAVAAAALVTCGLALGLGASRVTTDEPARSPGPDQTAAAADVPPDPMPAGAVARMGSLRLRHPGGVETLAFGLGGKVLVSAQSSAAHVWDARTGELLKSLGRRPDDEATETVVGAVGMSADGRTLTVEARRMLDKQSSVSRSFTWSLEDGGRELRDFRIRRDRTRRGRFTGPHVFAPDGSAMAEVDLDQDVVWVWDKDGNPVAMLEGAVGTFSGPRRKAPLAFAPDGKVLYTVLPDHTIKAWDVATKTAARSFGTGKPTPLAVAVSADGTRLATFGGTPPKEGPNWLREPEAVRVWNPATGEMVREIAWNARPDEMAAFLGFDGQRLWAAGAGRAGLTFRLFDPATGKAEREWTAPTPGRMAAAIALSPGAERLAVGFGSGTIQLFDAATGKEVTPGGGHRGEVTGLRFTPDAKHLVTVSEDRTARAWDAVTGKELALRDGLVEFVRLSADGAVLFGSHYRRVLPDKDGWDVVATDRATGRRLWEFPDVFMVAPHPDGKTVWAYRRGPKDVAVLDAATGQAIRTLPLPAPPTGFGDAARLAVCFDGKECTGWDTASGQKRFAWDAKAAGLLRSGTFKGRDQDYELADTVDATAVSPDGKFVALVVTRHSLIDDEQASLYLCEAATGKEVWRVKSDHAFGRSVEFSPDGKRVAVAGWKARVFDAATGDEKTVLDGHRGFTAVVAFSRDGKRLATGGSDGTAVVWDVSRR
jgi:RNA polymerase sigma factor (sigma-70 family)